MCYIRHLRVVWVLSWALLLCKKLSPITLASKVVVMTLV